MRRRTALAGLLVLGVAALLVSYVVFTQKVARAMQEETARSSAIAATVYSVLTDTAESASLNGLTTIAAIVLQSRVPLIVTDRNGQPQQWDNLPERLENDTVGIRNYVHVLDRQNPPVIGPDGLQTVHFGSTPLIRQLRIVPALQAASLAVILLVAVALLRTYRRAERDLVWAGMARESAHQIGTPLSSLHGWIDVLRDRAGDPLLGAAIDNMNADVDRLERVAHRFERIGRPPKRESVELASMVERVVAYFRSRVPKVRTPVHLVVDVHGDALTVSGDRVLLEWVLESLIKNAIDALAGVGGTITVHAEAMAGSRVRIRVEDDGPGVPAALRSRIFDAGFSTKEKGWGIGLALTRRIVEENHGGKLSLAQTTKGAAFDVILPA